MLKKSKTKKKKESDLMDEDMANLLELASKTQTSRMIVTKQNPNMEKMNNLIHSARGQFKQARNSIVHRIEGIGKIDVNKMESDIVGF